MKFSILIALLLASGSVYASKARVNSLLGASHLIDSQTAFTAPSHILMLDPFLTFEMGAAGSDAEGGALQTLSNDAKLYLYLGHQNPTSSDVDGDIRTTLGYLNQNNPVEILYGLDNMAYGASLSYVDNERSSTKETSVILKWGMNMDDNWVYAHGHIISTAEKAGAGGQDEVGVQYLTFGGNWLVGPGEDRVYAELDFGTADDDLASGTSTDVDDLNLSVGYENRSLRTETADIYYGIQLVYAKREYESLEISGYRLPATLGLEYFASDWATLRASVSQNILFGQEKDEVNNANDETDGIPNDTTVAAGLGLRYKDVVLDGSLTAATNGNVNGSSFLSQASLTYFF